MENKLTDNEIIKALECCIPQHNNNKTCEDCPLDTHRAKTDGLWCDTILMQNALDLINRQKAEIFALNARLEGSQEVNKILKAEIERLKEKYELVYQPKAMVRAEAIKAFAERLKGKLSFGKYIQPDQIDNLVKEMLGEE